MNNQGPGGIEYVHYTWNPVAGCRHDCRWQMPDGETAVCYAKRIAEGLAQSAYPHGFEHHYWNPHRLDEPLRVKQPSRIFLDSMSDLMGWWVDEAEIRQVFEVVRQAHWHQFLLLTKNPGRLIRLIKHYPRNLWVGVSMPPTWMNGKRLTFHQQKRYVTRTLDYMVQLQDHASILWWSFEPLAWDVAQVILDWKNQTGRDDLPFDWSVIGAATHGRVTYQPEEKHVRKLLRLLSYHPPVPVFFKGNLEWEPHQEHYPAIAAYPESEQLSLF